MRVYTRSAIFAFFVFLLLSALCCHAQDTDDGFLSRPPVFLYDEEGVPLTLMGTEIPPPGRIVPGFESSTVASDGFRVDGDDVQPDLRVKLRLYRLSALAGLGRNWAGGVSIPWQTTEVSGAIGGLPATADTTGLGNISFFAKRRVWQGTRNDNVTITGGIELPTGRDDVRFDQSNAATNGYYTGYPGRLPLSWQPSTGSTNGLIAAAYGRAEGRLSYMAVLSAKLHSRGDEDVKIGDIFIAAANGTYGITRNAAVSLALVLRSQSDDDYPQAPAPGVDAGLLAGTTNHGTALYLTPSVRLVIGKRIVVGAGVKYPIIRPDNGMVPETRGFLIIYPNL